MVGSVGLLLVFQASLRRKGTANKREEFCSCTGLTMAVCSGNYKLFGVVGHQSSGGGMLGVEAAESGMSQTLRSSVSHRKNAN